MATWKRVRAGARGEEMFNTGIETAFIAFFCATARKGDVGITGVFVDTRALWF